jgi:hypothetical protein
MALQETLFVAGIVVLGIAAVFFGIATYIYFDRNIPSILEELNGTEHVETLVAAEKRHPIIQVGEVRGRLRNKSLCKQIVWKLAARRAWRSLRAKQW